MPQDAPHIFIRIHMPHTVHEVALVLNMKWTNRAQQIGTSKLHTIKTHHVYDDTGILTLVITTPPPLHAATYLINTHPKTIHQVLNIY